VCAARVTRGGELLFFERRRSSTKPDIYKFFEIEGMRAGKSVTQGGQAENAFSSVRRPRPPPPGGVIR
jgi:hypothetical protein